MVAMNIIFIFLVLSAIFIFPSSNKDKAIKKNKDIKSAASSKAHGIIFGKNGLFGKVLYSPSDDEGHTLVIGGSGCGKTSAVLIPTINAFEGNVFVIDISGDIEKNVDCKNKITYNPFDENTTPYNIFGSIDKLQTEAEKNEALEKLGYLIMPTPIGASDSGRYFNDEGRKILIGALIAFYHKGADFVPICERFCSSSYTTLFQQIKATKNEKAIMYISSFEGNNERNISGCFQSACSALHLFAANETIKKTIRRPKESELNLTAQALNNYNLFVCIPDEKLDVLSSLLHIITAQVMDFLSARSNDERNTILLCLDEFASLGKLEITPALRKLRKKRVRIILLTQSLADIDLIYGKNERDAMLNNFNFKLVLQATDVETQKYFSELSGVENTKRETVSKSSSGYTENISVTYIEEAKIKPAEFSALNKDLILLNNGAAYRLRKNYYFKSRAYKMNNRKEVKE